MVKVSSNQQAGYSERWKEEQGVRLELRFPQSSVHVFSQGLQPGNGMATEVNSLFAKVP